MSIATAWICSSCSAVIDAAKTLKRHEAGLLSTIGRPDELRDQPFARTLTVRTLAPLPEPGRVFTGLPTVDSWRIDGPGCYVLTVSDPTVSAPLLTRALVDADADVLSISESHHTLEDVYLELIDTDDVVGPP